MSRPYYETADQMVNRINMYMSRFQDPDFDGRIQISEAMWLTGQKPSITGLALFLGFSSVGAFKRYSSVSDDFEMAVAYGYLMIENHYEHLLQTEKLTRAGEIGLRKVGEWKDTMDVSLAGGGSNVYLAEAIKKWQQLKMQLQSQVAIGEQAAPAIPAMPAPETEAVPSEVSRSI